MLVHVAGSSRLAHADQHAAQLSPARSTRAAELRTTVPSAHVHTQRARQPPKPEPSAPAGPVQVGTDSAVTLDSAYGARN